MRNLWIKFGCFLTGYNFLIVKNLTEITRKTVLKYTAALMIVCILWAFVGYTFTQRYLNGSTFASIMGAIIAIIIIIQIERQIILTTARNLFLYLFRGLLALLMSLIGAVIIDQIILSQDIEIEKISYIENKVNSLVPSQTSDIKHQISDLQTTIQKKDSERNVMIDDVAKNPLIKNVSSQTQNVPIAVTNTDSVTGRISTSIKMKPSTTISINNVPNPKQSLIYTYDTIINNMRKQKSAKEDSLLNVRPNLIHQLSAKNGFLDELKVMFELISSSGVALCFWLLWVLFLLFIELLVLISKIIDKESDYDKTVKHQMDLQIKRLNLLTNNV